MICKNCGKKIPDNSKFCPNCGQSCGQEVVTIVTTDVYNKGFNNAKSCYKLSLALGIVIICMLVAQSIIHIISGPKVPTLLVTYLTSIISFGGIAELILVVILLARYKSVKDHTKTSHLWITVGYPVIWGINVLIGIGLMVTILDKHSSVTQYWVFFGLSRAAEVATIILSFKNYICIKKTLHE